MFWRLEETCCYWSNTNYSIIELGQNTEKRFGDLRKLVTEVMQTTGLLSPARILRRILETWGNLLLLKPCKRQYYWVSPEYREGFWRLEETCCYGTHANYSIIELGQNTEKDFSDLRKLVVIDAMQTTVLLSEARILRRDLETWGNLLLLKPCKLQYYWARPEYWERFWRLEETCCYWSHVDYSIIELGHNTEKSLGDLRKLVVTGAMQTTVLLSSARIVRGIWRLAETCCYWRHANYTITELGQITEKDFSDLRKLVVTEIMQTTVLLSPARILRRVLEIWENLLLLTPCKLQYYWVRPEYWEETSARILRRHFRDLRKLVATEAMQTTALLSSAKIPRGILETWGDLLLLKPCKLQYYWARPEY